MIYLFNIKINFKTFSIFYLINFKIIYHYIYIMSEFNLDTTKINPNKRKSCDTIDDNDITDFFGTIGTKINDNIIDVDTETLTLSQQFDEIVEQAKKNAGNKMVLRSSHKKMSGGADLTTEQKQGLVSLVIISIIAYDSIYCKGITDNLIQKGSEGIITVNEGVKHIFNGLLKGYLKRIGKENVCDTTFDYLIDTIPNLLPLAKAPGDSCAVNLVKYTENLEKVKTDIIGYVLLSMGAAGAYLKTKFPEATPKSFIQSLLESAKGNFNATYDRVSYVVTLPFVGLDVVNKSVISVLTTFVNKVVPSTAAPTAAPTAPPPPSTTVPPPPSPSTTVPPPPSPPSSSTGVNSPDPNKNGGRKKKTLKMKKMKKVKKVKKTHKKKQRKTIKLKHKKGKKTRKH